MAADHWRKRVNGMNNAGCSSWEQHKGKKKKYEPLKNDLNTKTHISLEWDNHHKRVVAKREQIGIRQRDLRSVLVSAKPANPDSVADVVTVPQDVFRLENLMAVLSPEVWQSCLSVKEKNFLMKFLPKSVDAEETVDDLLSGENFHFGNPFFNWSSSLCAGNLHPDAILRQEQALKSAKRAHFLEIQNYHNNMIKYLQALKATCERSRDPAKEIFQKTLMLRSDAERPTSSLGNEQRFLENEEKVATSESCSLAEEKGCSSDNQNSSLKGGDYRERIYEKGNGTKSSAALDGARSGKVEKVHKHNIQHTDGAKYMSYLKISKKQHQLVKSMKQSGKSIQSKSLNRVLGNLDTLDVQPFEEFVKEEEKKLHEHWLQLAVKDLPAAYANWRERQFQRREIIRSLGLDLKLQGEAEGKDVDDEEVEGQEQEGYDDEELEEDQEQEEEYDDENEDGEKQEEEEEEEEGQMQHQPHPSVSLPYWDEDREDLNENNSGEEREEESDEQMGFQDKEIDDDEIMVDNQNDCEAMLLDQNQNTEYKDQSNEEAGSLDLNPEEDETMLPDQTEQHVVSHDQSDEEVRSLASNAEDEDEVRSSGSLQYQSPPPLISSFGAHAVNTKSAQVLSLLGSDTADSVDAISETHADGALKVNNNSVAEAAIGHGVPISSGEDVWSAVSMQVQSYYDSTSNYAHDQDFVSTSALIHPLQASEEQQTQLIDLGSRVHGDTRRDLSHRQSDGAQFGTCPEPDRSGLLQSLFKGQETALPFTREEQKPAALDFQPQVNVLMGGGQFMNGHIHGHLHPSLPLGQGQKRQQTEDYMRQNLSQDVYSPGSGGGYIIPSQTHVNLQDWNTSLAAARLPSRFSPPSLNGDSLLGQNWFHHGEQHQVRGGGWNGYDGSSSSGTSNQLRPSYPPDPMPVPSGQLMIPRNYGMVGGGVGGPHWLGGDNTLPQVNGVVHTHDYFSSGRGSDPVVPSMMMPDEGAGWMNLGHNSISNSSNPGFHDPLGKPYLRSWHQQ